MRENKFVIDFEKNTIEGRTMPIRIIPVRVSDSTKLKPFEERVL